MKIVTAQEMARIEQLAYAKGASEEAFMNQAGLGVAECVRQLIAKLHIKPYISLLCGHGNNAGDAYVAGALLLEGGFPVQAFSLAPLDQCSPLCQLQAKRFKEAGGLIHFLQEGSRIDFGPSTLLVDGILGTGFKGELKGLYKKMIEAANQASLPVVAVDIPSGINGTTGDCEEAIHASCTLALGLPKKGCFLGKAWNFVGTLSVFDFGLGQEFIAQAKEVFLLLEKQDLCLPPIVRTRHKYEAGYVVGLGGSFGMPGAPILTSFSALRAGAGYVRLLHPLGMELELGAAPPEIVREGYTGVKTVLAAMEKAGSVFLGPGIGVHAKTARLLKTVLKELHKPTVIDAEALTLMGSHDLAPPKGAVLTPHQGEMKRLLGLKQAPAFEEFLNHIQTYVDQHQVVLVLKGAPTFIFHPHQKPFVCDRGDPGMATAGSGDVLTGIIAAFLAQKMTPLEAAKAGVYIHALAGEKAASTKTSYSLIASDITQALPEVFSSFLRGKN